MYELLTNPKAYDVILIAAHGALPKKSDPSPVVPPIGNDTLLLMTSAENATGGCSAFESIHAENLLPDSAGGPRSIMRTFGELLGLRETKQTYGVSYTDPTMSWANRRLMIRSSEKDMKNAIKPPGYIAKREYKQGIFLLKGNEYVRDEVGTETMSTNVWMLSDIIKGYILPIYKTPGKVLIIYVLACSEPVEGDVNDDAVKLSSAQTHYSIPAADDAAVPGWPRFDKALGETWATDPKEGSLSTLFPHTYGGVLNKLRRIVSRKRKIKKQKRSSNRRHVLRKGA